MSKVFTIISSIVMTAGLIFSVTSAIYYNKLKDGVSGVLTSTESSVLFWTSIVMAIVFAIGLAYSIWHLIYNTNTNTNANANTKETALPVAIDSPPPPLCPCPDDTKSKSKTTGVTGATVSAGVKK